LGWRNKGANGAPAYLITIEVEASEFVKVTKRNWARLVQKTWLETA